MNRWRKWILYGVGAYASVVVFSLFVIVLMAHFQPAPSQPQTLTRWLGGTGSAPSQPYSGNVVPSTAPYLGSPDAKITIVEFGDFQCPFCQASSYVLRQVVNTYGSDVRLVFRHFPIEALHPLAPTLARASMCAKEQGKFWQVHDRFFQFQDKIASRDDIDLQVQLAGLNMRDYATCMQANRYQDLINQDLSDAIQLGAVGTPTWLVNGKKIEGYLTFDAWKQIIDSLR